MCSGTHCINLSQHKMPRLSQANNNCDVGILEEKVDFTAVLVYICNVGIHAKLMAPLLGDLRGTIATVRVKAPRSSAQVL